MDHALNFATHIAPGTVPHSYVLQTRTTTCSGCGTVHRRSDFYAHYKVHTTRTGKINIPCLAPSYNLPIQHIVEREKVVPLCHECPDWDLSHLPPPPNPARITPQSAIRPTAPAAPVKAASSKPRIIDLA